MYNNKETGKNEKEILLASDINTSFLSDWKSERIKIPAIDKIMKLAISLNASLDYLVGLEKPDIHMLALILEQRNLLNLFEALTPDQKEIFINTLESTVHKPQKKRYGSFGNVIYPQFT